MRSMSRRFAAVALACATALIGAGAGVVTSAQGQIRACVQKSSQQTRIIGDGEVCKATESLVVWSAVGPKGDPGPAGPQGQKGDTGAKGETGAQGSKGDTGATGAPGVKGDPGETGPQGAGGETGAQGPPGEGVATGTVRGRLMTCDARTHAPVGLPLALVHVLGQSFSALTDEAGNFQFNYVMPGDYNLGPPAYFANGVPAINPVHVVAGATLNLGDVQTRSFSTDPTNCGACGVSCGGGTCLSGTCVAAPATCFDRIKNQNETGVDCGGSCGACGPGQGCSVGADCTSSVCTAGLCAAAAPTCSDKIRNGNETDVDCGGPSCAACQTGGTCASGSDCASSVCMSGTCRLASCNDGVKNGTETDVDCGGNSCVSCAAGKICQVAADCGVGPANSSILCSGNNCLPPTCNAGFIDCDGILANGCEVRPATDVNNCGACRRVCPGGANATAACSAGACNAVCAVGFANCNSNVFDGCEVNLGTDVANCGACGRACGTGQVCSNNSCINKEPFAVLFTPAAPAAARRD